MAELAKFLSKFAVLDESKPLSPVAVERWKGWDRDRPVVEPGAPNEVLAASAARGRFLEDASGAFQRNAFWGMRDRPELRPLDPSTDSEGVASKLVLLGLGGMGGSTLLSKVPSLSKIPGLPALGTAGGVVMTAARPVASFWQHMTEPEKQMTARESKIGGGGGYKERAFQTAHDAPYEVASAAALGMSPGARFPGLAVPATVAKYSPWVAGGAMSTMSGIARGARTAAEYFPYVYGPVLPAIQSAGDIYKGDYSRYKALADVGSKVFRGYQRAPEINPAGEGQLTLAATKGAANDPLQAWKRRKAELMSRGYKASMANRAARMTLPAGWSGK